MKKDNPVRQVILGLSRYPVFSNHRTHRTHGNKCSRRYFVFPCVRCVPWFPAFRRQERICGWKNSPRIAQQSYLLVTEDNFAKAAGVAKVMVSPTAFCPKRSILAGLFKFLAVGCGLNDIAPSADSSGT